MHTVTCYLEYNNLMMWWALSMLWKWLIDQSNCRHTYNRSQTYNLIICFDLQPEHTACMWNIFHIMFPLPCPFFFSCLLGPFNILIMRSHWFRIKFKLVARLIFSQLHFVFPQRNAWWDSSSNLLHDIWWSFREISKT